MQTSEDHARHHSVEETMDRDQSSISLPSSHPHIPQDRHSNTDNDSTSPVNDSDRESAPETNDDRVSKSRESQLPAKVPSEAKDEESSTPSSTVASSSGTTPETTLDTITATAVCHDRHVKKRESKEQFDMMKAREDAKIAQLKATILDLERQEQELLHSIRGEGTPSEIIDRHIKELHRYNEIKDVGQIILGKCAEVEGTTIKEQYEKYGLDIED